MKIIGILAARIDKLWSLAKPITSARPIRAMCVFAVSFAVSFAVVLAGATASAQSSSGAEKAELLRPNVLSDTRVDYPAGARGDAEVVLELVIGEDGSVEEVHAKRGDDPFASASTNAAKHWRFEPARRGGKPVRARILMQVIFTEPEPEPEPEPERARVSPSTSQPAPQRGPVVAPPPKYAPEPTTSPAAPDEPPQPVDVVVRGARSDASKRLTRAEVRELPGAFGDPFRAVEILPGVTPVASGLPYFFVRGAPPGNVGYFFDGIPVPGLYHVAAGPAVIHPAFVRDVRLYSGAFPASYGRFAGAVVASSAAPPENRFRGEANLRLVDSGLMIETPFARGRGNVMAAGRYSHTGAIVSLLVPEVEVGYWDYQNRIQYRVSDRDTLTVFGFGAYDFLSAEDDDGEMQDLYDVTFHRLDLRYDRRLAPGSALRVSTTLGFDRARAGDRVDLTARSVRNRVLYTRRLSPKVLLRTGGDVQTAQYDIDLDGDDQDGPDEPGEPEEFEMLPLPGLPPRPPTPRDTDALVEARFASRTDLVTGAWLDFVLGMGEGVTLTPGFRFDVYAADGTVRLAPEPRLSARFELSDRVALLHDIGLAHQPPSFAIPVPGLQGSSADGLQRGVQSSAGAEVLLGHDIASSFTVFQSFVWGATDPLSLIQLQRADTQVSARADRVTSHTYGLEIMLRRSLTERLGGFASYTLSRSLRSTGRLRGPSSFDRTHVFNAAVAYDLGRAWRAGLRTAVYSGTPAEVAYAAAVTDPPRTPAFYRLDWRLEKRWPLGEDGFWAVVLEVLNTTLHKETLELSCYAYGCTKEEIGPVTIPSIGVEASF